MNINTVKKLIKKHDSSHVIFINQALVGERYYKNGSDILQKKDDTDEEGNPLRNANNKVPRNYHGLLVNQKVSYAFTAPPIFDIGNLRDNKRIEKALGDEYIKNCAELCVNAANTSVAWIHYWKSDQGEFEWTVVDSKQIIPIWDNALKKKLFGVLRTYQQVDEVTGDNYTIYEYWTDSHCEVYRRKMSDTIDEGLWIYEMFYNPSTQEATADYEHGMNDVPFIPFFNNNIHTSDLQNIKGLVDVYDKVYSGFINDLDDVQEIIMVLSGYGGTDLNGFLQDLKKYKVIKLDEDEKGGVDTLSIEIPVEARNTVLDITRKAIFEQGQGYDPQPENFGNQSGEALKFMYSLLEMKTGLMEIEFRIGFAKLIRAICSFYNIPCDVIEQTWTRTRIKNDAETAQICRDSVGIVSRKTILKNHPFVTDVEKELHQIEDEQQEEEQKESLYRTAFPDQDNSGIDKPPGSGGAGFQADSSSSSDRQPDNG